MRQRGKIIYTNDRLFKVSQLTAMRWIEKAWKEQADYRELLESNLIPTRGRSRQQGNTRVV